MSHQKNVQKQDLVAQARLLCLLDRNAEWYAEQQYELGLVWLEAHYGNDPRLRRALEGDEDFWNWWKNDWRHEDSDLSSRLKVVPPGVLTYTTQALSEAGGGATVFFYEPAEFRPFYLALHQPAKRPIKVPRSVLEAVQRKMRQEALAR